MAGGTGDAGICRRAVGVEFRIVERTDNAQVGDIVIAEVDGEWTMKYLRKRGKRFYLEAANPKYTPLLPQEELKIIAVVTGVVRKYT